MKNNDNKNKKKIFRIIKRIFFLPILPTLIIAIPSYAFMIMALTGQLSSEWLEYIAYVLSAYALVISVTGVYRIVCFMKSDVKDNSTVKKFISIPVVDKILNESTFRTEMALYPGFCINVLYVIFKTATGIYYRSAWFISLGVYYLALAVMRLMLIHYMRVTKQKTNISDRLKDKINDKLNDKINDGINYELNDELRRYRMCGFMLFLINAAVVGITILSVRKNMRFMYPGYLIYVMAMYAFYSVINAVINLVKYRKYGSPVLSAAKVINMSTALVSIFSLETAMLTQFGENNTEQFRIIMTALTGAGISFIVIGMAVYMVIHSSVILKKELKKNKTNVSMCE